MKSELNVSHVELVDSLDELNNKLQDGYVLIETVKQRYNDYDGFTEVVRFYVGK